MRAIGRGSISSVLKVAVDVAWVIACAMLGFIWIITAVSVVALMQDGGPIGGFERIVIEDPREIAIWTINGTILCIGVMFVCAYLRGVFETLVEGDPFVPENARRLRSIALVLAVVEVVRMCVNLLAGWLLSVLGTPDQKDMTVSLTPNLSVWFAVLTLLVLAQVFREGAAMREEQKMTV
jgi:hypothetical protein